MYGPSSLSGILLLIRNAKELIITDCLVIDSMLPYARSFALQGKPIEYFVDDRVIIKGGEEDED